MSKVVLTKDDRIEENFPAEWPAVVQVELTNGERFETHIRFPKGDPQNPLSWGELAAKFSSLAIRLFSEDRCRQIVGSTRGMNASSMLRDTWELTRHSDALSLPAH
jgi:2-methylcitrate dehydratase PrpD